MYFSDLFRAKADAIREARGERQKIDDQVLDDVTSGLEDNASLGLDNQGTGDASGPPSAGFFYDDGADGDMAGAISQIFGTPLGNALSAVGGMTAQWTFLDDLQVSAFLRLVEKQENVEVPADWSQLATKVVVSKYFYG